MNTHNQDAILPNHSSEAVATQDLTSTDNSILTDNTVAKTAHLPKQVGKLELLEERAVVHKERLDVGKVVVTKHIRTKTINVPIDLIEEVLTVTTTYDDVDSQSLLEGNYDDKDVIRHVEPVLDTTAQVTVNGHRVTIGEEPIEIVLSRQVALINKETHIVQEVAIEKSVHTHQDQISVELKREELDVKEEGFLSHDKLNK